MERNSVNPTDMELANSLSSPSSTRSSTPIMTNCERLQIVNSELRKFTILHANVSHAIEAAAPYAQDDDSDLADMYSRQHYLDQRLQKAVSDLTSLPRCNTPGCRIHNSPVNSPTKINVIDYPELTKNSTKRKESDDDGFISPTAKQTFKIQRVELKNFDLDTTNKFDILNKNDVAGTSQSANNVNAHSPTLGTTTEKTTEPNTLPPPAASKSQTVNSKPPQQMATLAPTRRKPATSSINQVVTPSPILTSFNVEDTSPQQLLLQSLQQTIQALTQITQQLAALNFNNPTPPPKKQKTKLTKPQLQALLEAYLDNDDE
ncbi:hypothetical protein TNIN_433091 [Trichonephila inaurata madagascariensis]|uniref:Uncharacterized protein n=2 Tax=Trichonephila inaurata madagascariensis TaxID=2747483 RepID=A0A8X6YUB9_9ARAC|nr:hypothetical protein TNIN_433091 [Trichonephila inaurata madagascariensis]